MPLNNKKIIGLSLATCTLLGIIGFEALQLDTKREYSYSPFFSYNADSERLQVELNRAMQHVNEMKRLLFVKNGAPESAKIKKIRQDIEAEYQNSQLQADQKIAALQARVLSEVEEKQSILNALELHANLYNGSIEYGALLADEIAILTALQSIEAKKQNATHDTLALQVELGNLKLENEVLLKERANEALLALIQKNEELQGNINTLEQQIITKNDNEAQYLHAIGQKGALLEEEIAFEKIASKFENRALQSITLNQSDEIETLKNALLFEQLQNKLAQERLKTELEDLSYALISISEQHNHSKKNLEDHLLIASQEKEESESAINNLTTLLDSKNAEKQNLILEIANLRENHESEIESYTHDQKGKKDYIAILEHSLEEAEATLNEMADLFESLEKEIESHKTTLASDFTQKESKIAELENHLDREKQFRENMEREMDQIRASLEKEQGQTEHLQTQNQELHQALSQTEGEKKELQERLYILIEFLENQPNEEMKKESLQLEE